MLSVSEKIPNSIEIFNTNEDTYTPQTHLIYIAHTQYIRISIKIV